jgi:xanthosine utilization system XapX-like protein
VRYYLSFVALGLLMGGVCLVLEFHAAAPPISRLGHAPPAMAMIGLFGAQVGAAGVAGLPA